ncbi:synaptobrevin-domain-containing protein [Gorgonomyces haynaldii]|nr:synaptobrevin-domain-containing protein [Gorgonomyces haynaldii]
MAPPEMTQAVKIEKVQSPSKTQAVQQQVDEVINIMNQNIEKVMDRGERLENLNNKTDDLAAASLSFKKSSAKVESEMWWKNLKLTLVLVGVAGIAVTIVVLNVIPH